MFIMIPDTKNEKPSPESVVLDILSTKPRISMQELYAYFTQKYEKNMTLQGLYRIMRKLHSQRVIVREGSVYSIDASWIYNLRSFVNKLERVYFGENTTMMHILLHENEERTFYFDSVNAMDNFWTHALIVITEYYAQKKHYDRNAYAFTEHAWFQLVKTKQENALIDAYHAASMFVYQVIGSNTFLDNLSKHAINHEVEDVRICFSKKHPFPQNTYKMCIGDFVFTTKLPTHVFDEFEKIYAKVSTLEELNMQLFLRLIHERTKTHLTIHRNKKDAELFRKVIKKHFT
jgi:hypothetical protein